MTVQREGEEPSGEPAFADLTSWPVRALLERTAFDAAPASGSAAAVTAGLAAALAGKVARRSSRQLADADALVEASDELRERAEVLSGADATAVHEMISGSGPVPDDALAVPTQIREVAGEIAQIAARLAAHGKPGLHADAVAAGQLTQAARACADAILASNRTGEG